MIIDARTQGHADYTCKSMSGAVRCFLDTLPLDGPAIRIEKIIDAKGNDTDEQVFVDVVKRVRKVGEKFATRRIRGVLSIWKIANAHDADSEFAKPTPRKKWPFSGMKIGDVIEVKYGEYGKSNPQTYVHVYGKQSGMRFKTSRNGAVFIIERTH